MKEDEEKTPEKSKGKVTYHDTQDHSARLVTIFYQKILEKRGIT